jgi:hypothetical protein
MARHRTLGLNAVILNARGYSATAYRGLSVSGGLPISGRLSLPGGTILQEAGRNLNRGTGHPLLRVRPLARFEPALVRLDLKVDLRRWSRRLLVRDESTFLALARGGQGVLRPGIGGPRDRFLRHSAGQ